jgi:hypothetical protein
VVYKDAAHHTSGHGEKVGPILPVDALHVHKPEVGLVDQGSRLQAVTRAFAGNTAPGNPPKLFMYQGHKPLKGGIIPRSPCQE